MMFKKVAWNGIGLSVPEAWEPASLEHQFIRLGESGVVRADLQWRRIRGPFAAERHVRKLAKRFRSKGLCIIDPPDEWASAVESLHTSGLVAVFVHWQGGCGAVVHNPATGLAATLQFYDHEDSANPQAMTVLESFRDHWAGATLPWRMFGLRARIPANFLLQKFSFVPGRGLLMFRRLKREPSIDASARDFGRGPGMTLELERLVPADVVLQKKAVSAWAPDYCAARIRGAIREQDDSIAWRERETRFLRKPTLHCGQVWLDAEHNALLGVYAQGNTDLSSKQFTEVCSHYGAV